MIAATDEQAQRARHGGTSRAVSVVGLVLLDPPYVLRDGLRQLCAASSRADAGYRCQPP